MKCNMGKTDRIIRGVIGLIVITIGLNLQSWWGVIGIILLGTALVGWCPIYLPFDISTCKTHKN